MIRMIGGTFAGIGWGIMVLGGFPFFFFLPLFVFFCFAIAFFVSGVSIEDVKEVINGGKKKKNE